MSATPVNVLCFGGATGSIDLTPSGGTPPYSYSWTASNGGEVPSSQASSQDLTGLKAGTYTVVVTDAKNCPRQLTRTITQPAAALTASETQVNVLCFGGATGSIDLTPSGGTSPYTYAWTASAGGVIPTGQASSQNLSGLKAGTYTVVVTDANGSTGGCRAERTVTITQPLEITVSGVGTNVTCFDAADGFITVTSSNATTIELWKDGVKVNGATLKDGKFSGLAPGSYVIKAFANGGNNEENECSKQTPAITITQPLKVTVSGTGSNVTCFDAKDGTITPSGSYDRVELWSNGTNTGKTLSSGKFIGLEPGSYTLKAFRNGGNGEVDACTATSDPIVITQPDKAPEPNGEILTPLCDDQFMKVKVKDPSPDVTYKITQPNVPNSPIRTKVAKQGEDVIFDDLVFGKGYSLTATSPTSCESKAEVCGSPTTLLQQVAPNQLQSSIQVQSIKLEEGKTKVQAAPNPFREKVRFQLESAVSGYGSLELFNAQGQRVGVAFQGYVEKGRTQTIEYTAPANQQGALMYVFRVGDQRVSGKLLNLK